MILEEEADRLAVHQHGLVARRQLLQLGFSHGAIARRVRSRRFRLLRRGVYQVGPVRGKRASEMAALLAAGSSCLVGHTTALTLWDVLPARSHEPVHIIHPGTGRKPGRGIVLHRTQTLREDERAVIDHIPVTSLRRSIADSAKMLGSRELTKVIATVQRRGLLSRDELLDLRNRYVGRSGVKLLRSVLEGQVEPEFTRSEAERVCLELVRQAGLPRPSLNVMLGPYELDLFWAKQGVAVEVDGFAFHGSRGSFEADRRKDNDLRGRGVSVVRVTWRQLQQEPIAAAVAIGQALAVAIERRTRSLQAPG